MTLIIGDTNWRQFVADAQPVDKDGYRRQFGLLPRDYAKHPEGSFIYGAKDPIPLIPRVEWPDRIADMERTKSGLYHVWQDGLRGKILDQNGIPYCHAFSPAIGLMLMRCAMGLPYVEISAGSIGGPVTGFRSRGAWIMDDLRVICERGAATTEFVPMKQVSKSGWKPGAEENALLHRVQEWYEGARRNLDHMMTMLMLMIPDCIGLNWWGHAVTMIRPVDANPRLPVTDDRRWRPGGLNSWGEDYGEGGYFELEGSKMYPDEQYGPRVTLASAA